MDAGVRVLLLGGFALRRGSTDVPLPLTAQRAVAFVAVQQRPVLRAHAGATLWMDAPEARAAANLRSALWRVRRTGLRVLESDVGSLRLASGVTVDLHDAEALARLAIAAPAWWKPEDRQVELLADDLLPGWYDDWVVIERERYRQLRLHGLESLSARLRATGRRAAAVQAALAAVSADPLRESAQSALIKAFLAEGNVSEARRQLDRFRTLLRDELGVTPSTTLDDLFR